MIGRTISHYKIVRQLGSGGMGEVYLAEDLDLARKVALKFLSSSWASEPEALERFATEARAAAGLSHPNIATIYNVEQAEGQRFLVLEYLEGETLAAHIGRGPLAVDEVVRIAKAVAGALAHAHEAGIIHRDIKSANIMLTRSGVPKILDFGLALRSEETRVTRAGSTVGTANYMSPEQARGRNADARSDIWSLGVVLYEALTGRLPFTAESLEATVNRVLTAMPDPPTALRIGISLDLERVVLRCIEKDAELRYQHADDLLADLRSIESRESRIAAAAADTVRSLVAARPVSAAGSVPGAQLRRRLLLGVVAVAAIAIVIASFVIGRGGGGREEGAGPEGPSGDTPAPSIAVVDFRNLSDPDDDAPSTILTSALAQDRPGDAIKAIETVMSLSRDPHGVGEDGELLAQAYRAQRKHDAAAKALDDFYWFRRGWARYHYFMGQIREEQGRKDEATRQYERFLRFWHQADPDRTELADARARLDALRRVS